MRNFRTIAEDLGFIEGPVISKDGGYLVTSIDRSCVYAITAEGKVSKYATTGWGPNGLTDDAEGNLYVALNGGRIPFWASPDQGGLQFIAAGKPDASWLHRDPISPNDLCFDPHGSVLITDPTRDGRRDDGRIWRYHVKEKRIEFLGTVGWYPNGIGYGADKDTFLVADTSPRSRLVRMAIRDGRIVELEDFARIEGGRPDGFAFDTAGNVVVGCPGEEGHPGTVQVFDARGSLQEVIEIATGPFVTNVALSATELIVCDSSAGRLLACPWPHPGLPLFPHRR